MKPSWNIQADGKDVTAAMQNRLISLRLTDERGMQADQLDITLSDHDSAIAFPRRGAQLRVAIGMDYQLTEKGEFTADEIEHTGPPDQLTIRARSADFRESLKAEVKKSWHQQTLGQIVQTIAANHSLNPAIDKKLASQQIPHLDQTESDANLLTRLAKRYDAVATIKMGNLLFTRAGTGTTATGSQLPVITLTRSQGDRHAFRQGDRNSRYTGVEANWRDTKKSKTKRIIAGADGYKRILRETYPTQAEAQAAANSEWQRMQRGATSFSITLATGNPSVIAESPVTLQGYRPEIDSINWIATRITHSINNNGFTTQVELEEKLQT